MRIGVPKERRDGETRVAISAAAIKKLLKKGFQIFIEKGAGDLAGFSDADLRAAGAEITDGATVFACDIVFKLHPPTDDELARMSAGVLLLSHLEPYTNTALLTKLKEKKISAAAMELIPRTSRAQSMDALSSQANIAGYRSVLEASTRYRKFLPMMMTSAGMSKPAKLAVIGVGVAGLQAIATARRLGAAVEAYDVRPEVREQILSLGAKPIDIDLGESGSGSGGYARELSEEAKQKQQRALQERLSKFDILITTANIPGRKAPILVTEETVKQMSTGSVIIDMAAANGGNCPLSEANQIVEKHGVILVGLTNYPALVPGDASLFYSNNLVNLLDLFFEPKEKPLKLKFDWNDDIVAAAVVTHAGEMRFVAKN